jgi:hypothetical protein
MPHPGGRMPLACWVAAAAALIIYYIRKPMVRHGARCTVQYDASRGADNIYNTVESSELISCYKRAAFRI